MIMTAEFYNFYTITKLTKYYLYLTVEGLGTAMVYKWGKINFIHDQYAILQKYMLYFLTK